MKKFLIALFLFLLGLYVVGFFLPATWRADRSGVIEADRALVHSYVTDLHTWPDWTTWNRTVDPDCEWTYFGPPAGEGAGYTWKGPELGEGRMVITSSSLSGGIEFELTFGEGDEPAYGEIVYADDRDGTRVTWSLWGTMDGSIGRWAGLMMTGLVGSDLEESLSGLERACETGLAGRVEQGAKDVLETILD